MTHSQTQYTDPQQQQYGGAQGPASMPYVFTEEEKKVFQECSQESFYYRSLPFATVAMTATHLLVLRGVLNPSPRFGSLPKVAFAGLMGYIGGKLSYTKTCQEKFKNLENSPLGEALRQGRGLPQQLGPQRQPEMSDPNQTMHEPALRSVAERRSHADSFSYPNEFSSDSSSSAYQSAPFSSAFSDSAPMAAGDDLSPQAPTYLDNETPKKMPVLYEDLRVKNRENYEVMLTQKAETLLKPSAEVAVPKKDVKKNQYGDAWDE